MTLNKSSIKWLPKISLAIGLIVLAAIVVVKANNVQPELSVLNTLETVNVIQITLKSLFF